MGYAEFLHKKTQLERNDGFEPVEIPDKPLILPHWLYDFRKDDGQKIYIYCLIDPITQKVRYIGKSKAPRIRLLSHMNDRSGCHKSRWLQKLRSEGLVPMQGILEECSIADDWEALERKWIALAKEIGCPLVNATEGGDGVVGVTPEVRAKITAFHTGRKRSDETRKRISDSAKGKQKRLGAKLSEETKKKLSVALSGRKHTEERKAQIGASFRGKAKTPEQRAKMSLARKAWWNHKRRSRDNRQQRFTFGNQDEM